jgi:hypothetical protein
MHTEGKIRSVHGFGAGNNVLGYTCVARRKQEILRGCCHNRRKIGIEGTFLKKIRNKNAETASYIYELNKF